MGELAVVVSETGSLVVRFAPVLVVTVVLSALLRRLSLADRARDALLRRPRGAVLMGAGIGAFSPFCSCTVVPVVRGFLRVGVPLGAVMAFWIASPLMDVEILLLTVAILGLPLAIARLLATLVLSVGAGAAAQHLQARGWFGERLLVAEESPGCGDDATAGSRCGDATDRTDQARPSSTGATASAGPATLVAERTDTPPVSDRTDTRPGLAGELRAIDPAELGREVAHESWVIGRWLLLAFAMEVLIVRYVPQEAIVGLLGTDSALAIPFAALLGIPLYVTNVAALPIVAGLLDQGMQPGAAIAFLVAGPVTTLPAMAAVRGTVNGRVFAFYLAVGLAGAVAAGSIAGIVL
jgi:uncharacterized protein